MPVVINIFANIILGAVFALIARESPSFRRETTSWAFLFLLGFEATVVTPIATYLVRFYPEWSLFYMFDPQIYPTFEDYLFPISALAIVLNFGACIFGFLVTRYGLLVRKTWMWSSPLAASGLAVAVLAVALGRRLWFIGDFDAFWHGTAALVLHCTPGRVGIALYIVSALFAVWVHSRFSHHDPSIFQ